MQNLVEIHPKAQRNHGTLQQKLGNVPALRMKRMRQRQSKDEPAQQCDRRRKQATGRKDHTRNEYRFVHRQSLACQRSAFQGAIAADERGSSASLPWCNFAHSEDESVAQPIFSTSIPGNLWYTSFALNTAVVLCGPSGSLSDLRNPPSVSSVSFQRNLKRRLVI